MMGAWEPDMTEDDVKNLAPDRAAFAEAKKLANPSKWQQAGRWKDVLWGTAIGSQGDYAVYLEPASKNFSCSCPSRKRPCKHALGLLLRGVGAAGLPEAEPPAGHIYDAQERYRSSWE